MSEKVKSMDRSTKKKDDTDENEEGSSGVGSRVREGVSAAKERLQTAGSELSDKVKSVSGDLRDQAGRASEFARERYGTAKERLGQGYERARKDLDQLSGDVTTYVRDNPGKSVLVAAGLGFLIGFLLRGERQR